MDSVHTPIMSLKNASFLALVGMILLTIMWIIFWIRDVLAVARGIIAMDTLLASTIYAFAGVSLTFFFYTFHKSQR
jgi:hypothetical protein